VQYLYLVGVGIILFFGFMFVTEQLVLKQRSKPVAPANPTPPVKPVETAAPRQKDKKKGRRR
jgi:hypothetical protein